MSIRTYFSAAAQALGLAPKPRKPRAVVDTFDIFPEFTEADAELTASVNRLGSNV